MYIVKVSASWNGGSLERAITFGLAFNWLKEQGVSFVSEGPAKLYEYNYATVCISADQYIKLNACKDLYLELKCEVKHSGFTGTIERLLAKTEELIAKVGYTEEFNGRCNVHMPGNLLMQFNETLLLEDSCTDKLQDALDKGWRVVAACPQPGQRRPDYILGRFSPDPVTGAARRMV